MFRIRPSTVLFVLALFLASAVVSSIAPLVDKHDAPGHDTGALALLDLADAGGEGSGGDNPSCNHACHLLHHFQGSVEGSVTTALQPRSRTYLVAEPGVPAQLFLGTRLRPPRFPAQSV